MAELKTKANEASVTKFLDSISDEKKRHDAYKVMELMQKATGAQPKMWGSSIVGFGDQHLVYDSGRELDWFIAGFSPRKQNLTLYGTGSGWDAHPELLENLGKHSMGKGCLYIKKLDDVNVPTLKKLIGESVKSGKKQAQAQAKKQSKQKK